jgi:hypothetical protein
MTLLNKIYAAASLRKRYRSDHLLDTKYGTNVFVRRNGKWHTGWVFLSMDPHYAYVTREKDFKPLGQGGKYKIEFKVRKEDVSHGLPGGVTWRDIVRE